MTGSVNLWIGAISLAAGLAAAAAPGTGAVLRVVSPAPAARWIELPRAAVVTERDDSGERWKWSGEIPVALTVARRDFEVCLGRQGWARKHAIPTGVPGQRAELQNWQKGGRKLLLLLSEDGPGTSTFRVGPVEPQERKSANPAVNGKSFQRERLEP